jgi:hypothetical protein
MTERNKQRGIYDDSRRRIFLKHIEIARRLAEQKHINMPSMRE